jgi:small-conductance mechanosensitive channel
LGATVATGAVMLALLKSILLRRLGSLAKRTRTKADDLIVELLRQTRFVFLLWMALALANRILLLPADARQLVRGAVVVTFLLQVGLWVSGAIAFWVKQHTAQRMATDAGSITTVMALGYGARVLLWAVLLLLALDNMGVHITTLVAGLGVTGLAVALAVQNILGDLFGALSIVLDRPFVVGDAIEVDQFAGQVEHIGLKTTRLRSVSGEQVIFSNADLLKSRIRNYKRMSERRVAFTIGVVYGTPQDALARIPAILRQVVEAQPHTRFDRSHFRRYGDSSLDFETVYYMTTPDYAVFMDVNQAINLDIYRRFADAGIEFAHPTRTVVLRGGAGGGAHDCQAAG